MVRSERIMKSSPHPSRLWLLTIIPIVFFILLAIPLTILFRLDGPTAEQGQTRAQPLIDALERYRGANGEYPPDLETLVPTYIETIPKPAWRYHYVYIVCPDKSYYTLGFRPRGHSDLTPEYWDYSSLQKAWKFGDGAPAYVYEKSC
jgi:hypothetical protein